MHTNICVTSKDIVSYTGYVHANHKPKYYLGGMVMFIGFRGLNTGDLHISNSFIQIHLTTQQYLFLINTCNKGFSLEGQEKVN